MSAGPLGIFEVVDLQMMLSALEDLEARISQFDDPAAVSYFTDRADRMRRILAAALEERAGENGYCHDCGDAL